MSIFNINSSKQPSNKIRIKYDENIVSANFDSIKNQPSYPSHYYAEFLSFISYAIGIVTDKSYYPIFSNGSIPNFGNAYNLSSFIYKFINDRIISAQNLIFGDTQEGLDPNQMNNYNLTIDQQILDEINNSPLPSDADTWKVVYQILYDPNKELSMIVGSSHYEQ